MKAVFFAFCSPTKKQPIRSELLKFWYQSFFGEKPINRLLFRSPKNTPSRLRHHDGVQPEFKQHYYNKNFVSFAVKM